MTTDTIAAIATPVGSGGIGIIKISGPNALPIAESIFRRSGYTAGSAQDSCGPRSFSPQSHRMYYGHIVDAEKGQVLDEVLLSVMLGPNTYTMENVVEINSHSGQVVLASILALVLKKGARLAEAGEFTKRAYLNGRIDLTQAEAVMDIINSRTEKSLQLAAAQIKGNLKGSIESIRDDLLRILVETEAAIDFPDDIEDVMDVETAEEVLENRILAALKTVLQQHENAHIYREGLKMAVIGKPNVGKSSLLNRLIQNDRAIVTPIPGTTRDLIEETLNIEGIPVIIADTAGLHDSSDPVEIIGIQKTQHYINDSDLLLFMVDAGEGLTAEDYKIYETIHNLRMILVFNKIDLVADDSVLEPPDAWIQKPSIKISARYGRGIDDLKNLIVQMFIGDYRLEAADMIVPNVRHKIALERSLEFSTSAVEQIRRNTPMELVAIDIREAIDGLDEILGLSARQDVIDQIFSRFCVGK
jgi:tRNA modification GTPase